MKVKRGSDRRLKDRRKKQIPVSENQRRKENRRSGKDRRNSEYFGFTRE